MNQNTDTQHNTQQSLTNNSIVTHLHNRVCKDSPETYSVFK